MPKLARASMGHKPIPIRAANPSPQDRQTFITDKIGSIPVPRKYRFTVMCQSIIVDPSDRRQNHGRHLFIKKQSNG
jgi:hypothetical protein